MKVVSWLAWITSAEINVKSIFNWIDQNKHFSLMSYFFYKFAA